MLPKPIEDDDPSLQKPEETAIEETTEKTRQALEKLISNKISAAMPVRLAEKQAPAQYIRYVDIFFFVRLMLNVELSVCQMLRIL